MEFIKGHYYLAMKTQGGIPPTKVLSAKGSIRQCVRLESRRPIFSFTAKDIEHLRKIDPLTQDKSIQINLGTDWYWEKNIWTDITHDLLNSIKE